MSTEINKQTKAYIIAGAILLVLIIGVAIFLAVYNPEKKPSETSTTTNAGEIVVPTTEDVIKNVLVVGVDATNRNTDIIMIASLNQTDKTITVISLPRDTYVNSDRILLPTNKLGEIYGAKYVKSNSTTPEKDAISALKSTLEMSFAITINDYAVVDLSVFRSLVDKVGGISFEVPVDMDYEDPFQNLSIHLKKGTQLLNGNMAEQLIRYKSSYPNDDLGRLDVAQQFLTQLYQKVFKELSLTESIALGIEILNGVKTSLTSSSLADYLKTMYSSNISSIRTTVIPGQQTQDEQGRRIYVINKKEATSCVSAYLDSKHTAVDKYTFDEQRIFTTTNESYISALYNK